MSRKSDRNMFSQYEMSKALTAKVFYDNNVAWFSGKIGKGWVGLIPVPRRLSEAGIFHIKFYFI